MPAVNPDLLKKHKAMSREELISHILNIFPQGSIAYVTEVEEDRRVTTNLYVNIQIKKV